jgi:RHS repeat-associated protein
VYCEPITGYNRYGFPLGSAYDFPAFPNGCTNSWPVSWKNPAPSCGQGNPIDEGSANKHQTEVIYSSSGAGGLTFSMRYNSLPIGDDAVKPNRDLGYRWRNNFEARISVISGGGYTTAYVTRPDGRFFYFNWMFGVWAADADIQDTLQSVTDGTGTTIGYRYRYANTETGDMELYDTRGRLLSITSREGRTLKLSYSDGAGGLLYGTTPDATGYLAPACAGVLGQTAPRLPGLLMCVTDTFGRQLNFAHDDTRRRIKVMTDPDGKVYHFAYDGASGPAGGNNLTSVTFPATETGGTPQRTYWYGEAANVNGNVACPTGSPATTHWLTGISDENSVRYATFQYDCTGKAVSTAYAGDANRYTLAYQTDAAGNPTATVVTDPLGTQRTYNLQTVLGVVKSTGQTQPAGAGCPASGSSIAYDVNGNIASRTDFNGNTSCHAYDLSRNLETARIEGIAPGGNCPADVTAYTPAVGTVERKITTTWHPDWRLEVQRAEPKKLTTWVYNGQPDPTNGNAVASCASASALLPDGKPIAVLCKKIEQATTDSTGALGLAATLTGSSRIWTYTYNGFGQVTSLDGPRTDVADVTTLAYDAAGNLISVTNALGHVTTYSAYDAHGRAGRITDPSGVVTEFAYDVRGRLMSRTVDGKTTAFEYDGVGQLAKVTPPDGAYLRYTYDAAHRRTDLTDALGNKIHTTYDLAGNKTKEEVFDPSNTLVRQHQWVYDTLSQLTQSIGAAGQTTTYAYDANGNRTSVTDPLNRVTHYTYDALNRRVSETDSLAGITGYSYDALDHLLAVTDPANLTTTYTYDGFGDLLQETSPNTGVTTYTYTPYGQVASRTDARGISATYAYDLINRLTKVDYPAGIEGDQLFFWDRSQFHEGSQKGRLRQAGEIAYGYDNRGNVTIASPFLRNPADYYRPRYEYDDADRLIGIEYLSGRYVRYQRGSDGQIRRMTVTDYPGGPSRVLADNIQYAPFGPLKHLTYGNGKTLQRHFDLDGRLSRQTLDGVHDLSYSYDPVGQITAVVNALDNAYSQTYGYDALGRLTAATGPFSTLAYGYDATGNRQSESHNGQTTTYHYLPTDQRLQSLSGSVNQSFAYDAIGNTVDNGAFDFAYGGDGRLRHVTQGGHPVADYHYWHYATGQRTAKIVNGRVTHFDYAPWGPLLSESVGDVIDSKYPYTDPSALAYTDYVYLDDLPLAQIDPSGAVAYLHPNHLGAPLAATHDSGGVAWQADYEPFGRVQLINPSLTLNLRLPGQYFDAETGLHQNWHRDYDPSLGRYLESDPIGLEGGINTYAYVENNPINWIDPTGLQNTHPGIGPCTRCHQRWLDWYNPDPYKAEPVTPPKDSDLQRGNESEKPKQCDDDKKDPCEEIRRQIRDIQGKLASKEKQLASDPYDLYNRAYSTNPGGDLAGKGTYLGHVAQIEGLRVGLARKIAEAKAMGCL